MRKERIAERLDILRTVFLALDQDLHFFLQAEAPHTCKWEQPEELRQSQQFGEMEAVCFLTSLETVEGGRDWIRMRSSKDKCFCVFFCIKKSSIIRLAKEAVLIAIEKEEKGKRKSAEKLSFRRAGMSRLQALLKRQGLDMPARLKDVADKVI